MAETLLELKGVSVNFKIKTRGFWGSAWIKAVDNISLKIKSGEILGIVGESGCGKSTLVRAITGLVPTSSGAIYYDGVELKSTENKEIKRNIQMVFQSPYGSLNPRHNIFEIISEPLKVHYPKMKKKEIKERVHKVLEEVGLEASMSAHYPHECSGGQCQRIGIARALILEPRVLICDEPISALDVSIQAQIINLLINLQKKKNLTILFIAHDLAVVRHISNRILVMYLGKAMEFSSKDLLYQDPAHPYSKALLSSVPVPDPALARERESELIIGEIPSPLNPPSGCVFHPRCPYAYKKCAEVVPELEEVKGNVHSACIVRQGTHGAFIGWVDNLSRD